VFDIKLIEKMWDTVARDGIGSLARPWQTRREGRANVDARRDELLMLAQTEIDIADIRAGKKTFTDNRKLISVIEDNSEPLLLNKSDCRIEPYFTLNSIEVNSEQRTKVQHMKEHINITKALLYAEDELEKNYQDQEGSDEDIDPDWLVRWRDCTAKVNSDELQRLWAKALAGEIANPGSYSLRTLEFIKNISYSEANEVSKLAPFVMFGNIYKMQCLIDAGLDFSYLLEMEDLGILSGVKGGGLNFTWDSGTKDCFEQVVVHNNKYLSIKHESESQKPHFSIYKVTKIGCEVLRLGVFPVNTIYLEQIGLEAKKQGFEVTLADWKQVTKDKGQLFNQYKL
jgi:uncharacterized protein YqfB (UPF0267 family)